ncbi:MULTISPECIES: aldo/keto reductase [Sorangium]|uniref:Oxidoreductase, aldo/keto reductase family n=1 Tax=Sorangium cellulosum (strain So ce56) TaxID=448385 RepID=A9GMV7_SORC5|nr:aldo/keto reductase [Sorangium cellulosum]CAN93492.1 oxidoreductase, aldo/keto reductase family [Sorangium cellulosum So ce56]
MTDLPTRLLGRTGVRVTTLGFGAMELRGAPRGPELSDQEAERILNDVLDAGINFIDTSIDYGRSEERIGRFLSHRRHEYFLASKCGCVVGGAQGEHVHTAQNIRHGVENSLRLLKTDHLDLVQFHRSLTRQELEQDGALEEALKLKSEGKVRFLGVSGTLPNLVEQIELGVFDAFQIPYSALQREHEEVIGKAAQAGAGTIIRGGVARGAPTDWQRTNYMLPGTTMQDRWERARLDELLDGLSRIEFTLRFTLSHPGLSTTIVGTRNPKHLRDNLEFARKGPLPREVVAEAKRRLSQAGSTPEAVPASGVRAAGAAQATAQA